MKPVFPLLSCFIGLLSLPSMASDLLVSTETLWVQKQGLDIRVQPASLLLTPVIELEFHSPNPRSLLEKGDFSLQRKILLNGSGTQISSDVFSWDLQLEINYKFI